MTFSQRYFSQFLIFVLVSWMAIDAQAQTDSLSLGKFGYEPDKEAKEAVGKIVRYTGLIPNFLVTSGTVPTVLAFIKGDKRYIAYNPDFIIRLKNKTNTDWAAVSVLAHEIAHHLSGHTLNGKKSSPGDELAADKFSGFILHQMGATLEEALAGLSSLNYKYDSLKYPPKSARLFAIETGWLEAKHLLNVKAYGTDSSMVQDTTPTVALIFKCRFDDDDNLYFVDAEDRIIWFDNYGKAILIGHKTESANSRYDWIYSYGDEIFGIDHKQRIWHETSPGIMGIIGRVEVLK
ncbi:MAG: hypothetical protein JKY52_13720 [Flavobacteriales bacterium]|nr:hypothetical protein [Flavobacteriales bacterium]